MWTRWCTCARGRAFRRQRRVCRAGSGQLTARADDARPLGGEAQVDVGVGALRGDEGPRPGGGVGEAEVVGGARRLVERDLRVAGVVGDAGAVVEANAVAVGIQGAAELGRGVFHHVGKAAAAEQCPGGAAPDVEGVLVDYPGEPALLRDVEGPGAVLEGGDAARLAGPSAGGA